MIKHFFVNDFLLKQLNHCFIALLPKEDAPAKISQFCPISLCNVSYKIISKILTSRLKSVMHKLISNNQAAFVPSRHIQDNLIMVHEIMQTLKRKQGRGGLMALKVDMSKAYDRVSWPFLMEILRCFGFGAKWCRWIYQCISTVSFSILLNGSPYGFFKPHGGLRQGDPLLAFFICYGD